MKRQHVITVLLILAVYRLGAGIYPNDCQWCDNEGNKTESEDYPACQKVLFKPRVPECQDLGPVSVEIACKAPKICYSPVYPEVEIHWELYQSTPDHETKTCGTDWQFISEGDFDAPDCLNGNEMCLTEC